MKWFRWPAIRIACAQINPTVGDIAGNARLITQASEDARAQNCDLLLYPELALTGYPPEDLLFKPDFIHDNIRALHQLAVHFKKTAAVIGFVDADKKNRYNAAAWIEGGKVKGVYRKQLLPNYGVFDEARYFTAGAQPFVRLYKGVKIAVTICEDIWIKGPHIDRMKPLKPGLIVNISASPYHAGKLPVRQATFRQVLGPIKAPYIYCNMVGGQDELVFDGNSFAATAAGKISIQGPAFRASVIPFDFDPKAKNPFSSNMEYTQPQGVEEVYEALVLGLRDYVGKNNFRKVTLGLSGGIDSALVAAIAAKALGPENVVGVTMPSVYNLEETISDAEAVAKNLGIEFKTLPIQPIFESYLKTLDPVFKGEKPNIAEENLQARVRGNLLMALSNKFGWLVLTTGNKSEVSTGYCTLYGDMAGGFSVLKDVLKTTVYELSRFINKKEGREVIPQTTIDRAPTAELRPNQKDEDSLGPYAELDPIVVAYVEENRPFEEIYKLMPGKAESIRRIISLIDKSEYKRRQAPPGIKITPRSFGRDHRMPLTNRYQGRLPKA